VIRMLEGKIAQMVNRRSTRVSDATEGLLPYAILVPYRVNSCFLSKKINHKGTKTKINHKGTKTQRRKKSKENLVSW